MFPILRYATLPLALALTTPASAGDQEVPMLGGVQLVLMNSLHDFETIELAPVTPEACETVSEYPQFVSQCSVPSGSSFTVESRSGDQRTTVTIDRMIYYHSPANDFAEERHEFFYKGVWTKMVDGVMFTSPATLSVQYYQVTPSILFGYLKIDNYFWERRIQGRR